MFVRAMASASHPILAQIIPIRRCNLACTYCNEFDRHSPPVPTAEMLRRIDKLGELGTSIITFSGGEPTLHPDLDVLIRRVRDHRAIATVITNGYFLVPDRIKRLIVESLNLEGVRPETIEDDAPLFGEGLGLDSVDALELVVALEKEFGIKIKSQEIGREVFSSVSTLSQFIEGRT